VTMFVKLARSTYMNRKSLLRVIKVSCSLVVLVLCSWNPADFLQEIQSKYDQFQQQYPSVKINMVFNQPVFSPGDTAFFKAWYMNEENLPVKGNHIITINLIAGTGSITQQIRFRVKDGSASNQIVFNKELAPGVYKIVAYTDWMKNFGEAWFYQKRIEIHHRNKVVMQDDPDHSIKFYSEGGGFVSGLENKLAIAGPPLKELIIKNQKATIQKLKLDSTGLGSMSIIPESEQRYFAEDVNGKSWSLPKSEQDGIVIQMDSQGETINLSIPPASKLINQEIFIVVAASGKLQSKEKIVLTSDQRYPLRVKSKQGVLNQVYIFNTSGIVLAHRVFYPVVRDTSIVVTMQIPPRVLQRMNVSGSISIRDKAGNPVVSGATITVLQDNLFKEFDMTNSYSSELPALVERIERFGKSQETLNDFLITQTWKRIDWKTILSPDPVALQFSFETQATFKGQVVSGTTGFPPPDSTVLLTYLQKNAIGYEDYVKKGKFEIPLVIDFWGADKIFCSLQHNSRNIDGEYTVSILKDSVKLSERWSSTETEEPSAYGEYAFKKKLISSSFNYFRTEQGSDFLLDNNPNSLIEEEFMGVDFVVNVENYLSFPTMKDLLREVVPYVQSRQKGDEESVKVFFKYKNTTVISKGDPLYVIDGLMCMNTSYFLSLKPEDIRFIKILNNPNKLSQLGKLGANGVIFVESKKGNLAPVSVVKNLFPITGLNRSVDFSESQIKQDASVKPRIPDLHSTIYWNPSLGLHSAASSSFNFSTGDDIGPIRIVVRGITNDGQPFSAEQVIEVGFDPAKN
jgi:hypothetical protein